MRYRCLRNTQRNMSGYQRAPHKKGKKTMAKKKRALRKKKSSKKRNRKATSKFNAKTGKWESTGVIRRKTRKKAAKKVGKKKTAKKAPRRRKTAKKATAKRTKGARRNRVPLTAAQRAAFASSDIKAREKAQSGKIHQRLAKAESDIDALYQSVVSLSKGMPASRGAASTTSASGKKAGKKKGGKKAAAKQAAPTRAKRARPGTKSKACKPFVGKRKRPVKCKPKPRQAELDACALAALRHDEDPRETCGPGAPRPTGRALAKHRWGTLDEPKKKSGKKRNFGINSSAWGD